MTTTTELDHLQDIASFIGVGGNNGATVEQLLERVKNEFLRLSNLVCAQSKQIEALQADADLCNWFLTLGENQIFNFRNVYDDWNGECDFKEYALAARKGDV